MSLIREYYMQQPAVSRTLATAVFVTSVGCYTNFIPYYYISFVPRALFQMPPQIWRPFTCFFLTMPQFNIFMDTYFLYTYCMQLETADPRITKREDLVWYLMFVGTSLMTLSYLIGIEPNFYLPGLIIAMAYTCTQDQRGQKANFMFFTIPAQLAPYGMLIFTFLMHGQNTFLLQVCGLLAAHMYDFLVRIWPQLGGGSNILSTPSFLTRLFGAAPEGFQQRSFGSARQGSGASAGSGSGPLPDAWRTRGRGQRLGGDP